MIGTICGDIIGSIYEKSNIKTKEFPLFKKKNTYTDDTVMTCAIANACLFYVNNKDLKEFKNNCINEMRRLGMMHINAGYGKRFLFWLISNHPQPYNSYGNGSAMRVSPIAWIAQNLEECEMLAEISSSVTHNHEQGILGAKAIAGSCFLALKGEDKSVIKEYIERKYYKLVEGLDEIRKNYTFNVSCQGSVPQAIQAFLESVNYEDAIRNAISIGGDSDTIAAIAGGLAEAYYGIPENLANIAKSFLDKDLLEIVNNFYYLKKEKSKLI